MESRVQRRIESISRHLLLPRLADHFLLRQIALNDGVGESGEGEAVVIGGMVLDIQAFPSIPTNPRTTAPGRVNHVLGGVARNVSECMSKLGTKPYLISVLGVDMAGNLLLEHWKSAGLSTEGILKSHDIQTPAVCCVLDINGEVAAAVASVEAVENFLTPEWIQQSKSNICAAPVVMIDANLNNDALVTSCQMASQHNVPVWFEPVSVAKSRKIASVVRNISFASPNEDELVAMANSLSQWKMLHPIQRNRSYSVEQLFQMLKPAIWVLLEAGIKILVVTIGSDGVLLCSKGRPNLKKIGLKSPKQYQFSNSELYKTVAATCCSNWFSGASEPEGSSCLFAVHFPSLPASVVRLTGAGDCLVGGMLASLCVGLDIMQSVAVGIAVAKTSVEAQTNVPSILSLEAIADDARMVYSAAKVLFHGNVDHNTGR